MLCEEEDDYSFLSPAKKSVNNDPQPIAATTNPVVENGVRSLFGNEDVDRRDFDRRDLDPRDPFTPVGAPSTDTDTVVRGRSPSTSSDESTTESSDSWQTFSFRDLPLRKKVLLGNLALAEFATYISLSVIAPFFPKEVGCRF